VLQFFQKLFSSNSPPEHQSPVEEAAHRFAQWSTGEAAVKIDDLDRIDQAINEKRITQGEGEMSEAFASEFASYLGELARQHFGGQWTEDPRFGYCLCDFSEMKPGRFFPLSLAEIKWESGESFKLTTFFKTLEKRLEAEKNKSVGESVCEEDFLNNTEGNIGQKGTEQFRAFWKDRFGVNLPITLLGVREVDGFLRSHYIACFLTDFQLITAGFFIGEVARGLFEGEWIKEKAGTIEKTALRFPELDYYPIGRIFKMMTEHPAGDPLDEYIRLIPSARRELQKSKEPVE
jgi:hypothetical protein